MPKKTKKQKMLAQQRRHTTSTLPSNAPSVHVPETNIPSLSFRFQESHAPAKSIENTDDREELTVIKKDLTKTLVFALIAIVIELGVYRMLRGA
jgi:hypothetical protein